MNGKNETESNETPDGVSFSASPGSRPSMTEAQIDALRHEDLSYFDGLPVRYWWWVTNEIERGHVIGVKFHNGAMQFLIRNVEGYTNRHAWAEHTEIVGRGGGCEEDFIDEVVAAEYAEEESSSNKLLRQSHEIKED